MKTILILGAGVMQGPAIRLAKARGWRTIVVDADASAANVGLADRFERIDLKDKSALLTFARSLVASEGAADGLSGIMTAGTDFSASVAFLAEQLGLPGLPYETALDASDKIRMRCRFRAAGVPSPDFMEMDAVPTPGQTLPFDYPVVVKPVDNMGARGCRLVATAVELPAAVNDALGFSRSGRAIVEQYMDGPEYSIDALVYDGEIAIHGVADRHIFFPPYFIEMGHTLPANLPADRLTELLEVFKAGVQALGITCGAAKGDVKYTSRGPMIGEIAARLSGGYMSGWTYPYATGLEATDGALSIAVGETPDRLRLSRNWTSAERAFISIPGTVESVLMVDEAKATQYVKDIFLRVSAGSPVQFPENNVLKCGNVIAAASNREAAVAAAETAARIILVGLRFPDPATDVFLATDPRPGVYFPPSAFALDESTFQALERLPESIGGSIGAKSSNGQTLALIAFPALSTGPFHDYQGRDAAACIEAAARLSGSRFRVVEAMSGLPCLGRGFWRALVRGSYQGAAYYINAFRKGIVR